MAAAADPTEDPTDEAHNSVLGKAHLILSAFHAGPLQLGLTELSRRAGVAKGTTHRLAQELVRWGLLERVEDSYQLGFRLFELGQRVPLVAVLRSVSRPFLIDLYADTRASIHMTVLDGRSVRFVEKITGSAHNITHSDVGRRFPATCTSSGKLLLALHPDKDRIAATLADVPFVRMTSMSVTTWPELSGQLAEIRSLGYAVELQETASGFGSVAVPVTWSDGTVLAAVSAAQTLNHFRPERLVPRLQAAALGVAKALQGRLADVPEAPVR